MAKSNWKGTSGWSAINDPTNALSGRVLVASAGITATNEDYLTTLVGSSTAFSATHYSVLLDYAFPNFQETHPFVGGTLGLIARSSNFQGDPQRAYDCYIGQMDVEEKKVKIIRRRSNAEVELYSADLPNSSIARGTKHTIEFKCYGTTSTTLQLIIDSVLLANIGDNATTRLTSGIPGIQVRNGTTYCDSFTVLQYTNDGTTPSAWTPNQITGQTLSAWYIGSEGVTATGTTVSAWADQSGKANNLTAGDDTNNPQLLSNVINNYSAIEFNGTTDNFTANDSDTLDMKLTGLSIFKIINTKTFAGGEFSIMNKGSSYAFGSTSESGYRFSNVVSDNTTSSSFVGSTEIFQLVGIVTDKDNTTGTGGLFVDGSLAAGITFGLGDNNDNSLFLGKSGANFFAGTIAEIVIIKGECGTENRQLVEGYLAHKYATSGSLPESHPYKNFAPIIQV